VRGGEELDRPLENPLVQSCRLPRILGHKGARMRVRGHKRAASIRDKPWRRRRVVASLGQITRRPDSSISVLLRQ
jgi:hypothetical protein